MVIAADTYEFNYTLHSIDLSLFLLKYEHNAIRSALLKFTSNQDINS